MPHRLLHVLPLHAFPIGDGPDLLLDRFPEGVRYAPSTLLARLAGDLDRPGFDTLWAAENPTGDLPFTELEMADLKRHFPQASVLRGEAATRSALDTGDAFQQSHCTHFASRGRFRLETPTESSPLPAGGDRLTLGDLFERRLPASRLAVLSACETGWTDITDLTDEHVGLPSGFLFAGSKAVVSSLWRVDDVSTSVLMMELYARLAEAGPGSGR